MVLQMGVQKLDWLSQRLDRNSIKHLWNELEHRLRCQLNQPAPVPAVIDIWMGIPKDTHQKPVESLPRCVQAVIDAKEEPILYTVESRSSESIETRHRSDT
ncbi:hypothetical protein TNCV_1892921 [Trichonephila clavipes]|nr:hypothetical protein TNCV_1892921 [Trichonephila clavipes]